jgi:hypothetical protein
VEGGLERQFHNSQQQQQKPVSPANRASFASEQLSNHFKESMMTYDPYQNYSQLGQYYGMPAPISLQYATPQTSAMNPAAAQNPFAANFGPSSVTPNIGPTSGLPQFGQQVYPGIAQGGINPQQQQLQLAAAIPQLFGASPWAIALQNQLLAAALHNPMIAANLQNPLQQIGWQQQQHSPFQQNVSPFGQQNPLGQNGFPLAPQSWVGQPGQFGGGQAFGQQIHPMLLSQLNARPFQQVPGIYPGGY